MAELIGAIVDLVALVLEVLVRSVVGVCRWAFAREKKRKSEQRGFEVKRNTGETAVQREGKDSA